MIVFDLECGKGHVFEAWFKDSATFERQHKRGLVTCAVCGSTKTKKAIMAPRLGGGKAEAEPVAQVPVVPAAAERKVALANDPAALRAAALMKELGELRRKIEHLIPILDGPHSVERFGHVSDHPEQRDDVTAGTALQLTCADDSPPTSDRKSTRLNSSHSQQSRMPSSA